MLEIQELNAFYGNIPALKKVSLRIPRGKIITIIGANGAGKSTLLKTISGLISSKSGRILYCEKEIINFAPHKIVKLGISQVPEGRQIFAHLKVRDNIHLGAYLDYYGKKRRQIDQRIQHIYGLFPILEKRANQIAGTLSGGEQQMLAIGRALMCDPDLILLDEPSMGLAPLIVREIFDVIQRLNAEGATILLVEQNARAALKIADYGYVLESGNVVMEGLDSELLNNPKVKEIYLGG